MTFAYLDHNATTPIRAAALAAATDALAACGNASSVHGWGRRARAAIEEARERVAAFVGAPADAVVFTSGGTEANNLALAGPDRSRVLVSAVEHDSVLNARPDAVRIPVDGDGIVDRAAFEALLTATEAPALVSVMLANNETGVIQPVAALAEIAHAHGALVHCDAVQAAGRIDVDVATLGVDMLSLSAHKIGGPQGAGALVVADHVALASLIRGGGQERGRRAGTENVAAIAGFGAAAEEARGDLARAAGLARLRDRVEREVRTLAPAAMVFGVGAERLANTSCIAMPGVSNESQLMAFDLAGVMVSAGAACSSGKVGRSHVLAAMGVADHIASTAIRVSLGWTSTDDDAVQFVAAWRDLYNRSRAVDARASAA